MAPDTSVEIGSVSTAYNKMMIDVLKQDYKGTKKLYNQFKGNEGFDYDMRADIINEIFLNEGCDDLKIKFQEAESTSDLDGVAYALFERLSEPR